jgi:hypothetical protein
MVHVFVTCVPCRKVPRFLNSFALGCYALRCLDQTPITLPWPRFVCQTHGVTQRAEKCDDQRTYRYACVNDISSQASVCYSAIRAVSLSFCPFLPCPYNVAIWHAPPRPEFTRRCFPYSQLPDVCTPSRRIQTLPGRMQLHLPRRIRRSAVRATHSAGQARVCVSRQDTL